MELAKAKTEDFDLIYSEMERNFVREEIRDRDQAEAVIGNEKYSIYHILRDGTRVGFITVWLLSGFMFVEHFVIYERFRNKGYGKEALALIKDKHDRILLEAEPPKNNLQKRRIAFYERCGFKINDHPYLQPSYRIGGDGVELLLLSYPCILEDCGNAVKEIYQNVYNV